MNFDVPKLRVVFLCSQLGAFDRSWSKFGFDGSQFHDDHSVWAGRNLDLRCPVLPILVKLTIPVSDTKSDCILESAHLTSCPIVTGMIGSGWVMFMGRVMFGSDFRKFDSGHIHQIGP